MQVTSLVVLVRLSGEEEAMNRRLPTLAEKLSEDDRDCQYCSKQCSSTDHLYAHILLHHNGGYYRPAVNGQDYACNVIMW